VLKCRRLQPDAALLCGGIVDELHFLQAGKGSFPRRTDLSVTNMGYYVYEANVQEGDIAMAVVVRHKPGINLCETTPEDRTEIFDRAAQRYFQMTGDELARKWDAGEFDDDPDQPKLQRVLMLRPRAK